MFNFLHMKCTTKTWLYRYENGGSHINGAHQNAKITVFHAQKLNDEKVTIFYDFSSLRSR